MEMIDLNCNGCSRCFFPKHFMCSVSAVNGALCVTDEVGYQREIFMMELHYSFFPPSNLRF